MLGLATLLQHHIYLALLLGGLFEGETVVVLAGFAAHQGYASWWGVTLVAALVNTLVDQFYFALGHFQGEAVLRRFPSLRAPVARLHPRLFQHRRWLILALRFSYGLRVAGPLVLGMARVPLREFALINAASACLWASIFTSLGYFVGLTLLKLLQKAGHYEHYAVAALIVAGIIAWLVAHLRHRAEAGPRPGVSNGRSGGAHPSEADRPK